MLDDREEIEHIPWSELAAATKDDRRPVLYAVAGMLGVVVLGIMAARAWWSSPEVRVAPGSTTIATILSEPAAVSTLPLYSEADLLATGDSEHLRGAITRAEWFVIDYFTADLEPVGSAEIRAALPPSPFPDFPHDGLGGISYVEWAKAFRVEEMETGRYRIGVAYRTLAAPPDGGFRRLPIRAVDVLVAVEDDGSTSILDIPMPTVLRTGPGVSPFTTATVPVPPEVEAIAAEYLEGWGDEPRFEFGYREENAWRIVLTIADEVGNRWPVVVMLPTA